MFYWRLLKLRQRIQDFIEGRQRFGRAIFECGCNLPIKEHFGARKWCMEKEIIQVGAIAGTIPGAGIGGLIGGLTGNKVGTEMDREDEFIVTLKSREPCGSPCSMGLPLFSMLLSLV